MAPITIKLGHILSVSSNFRKAYLLPTELLLDESFEYGLDYRNHGGALPGCITHLVVGSRQTTPIGAAQAVHLPIFLL